MVIYINHCTGKVCSENARCFSLGNFYGKVLVSILLELIFHVYRHTLVSPVLLCLAMQLTTVSLYTYKDMRICKHCWQTGSREISQAAIY